MLKNTFILIVIFCLIAISPGVMAKSKNDSSYVNPRLKYLSAEERDMFNNLTSSQQKNIKQGKIKTGYNAWMVKLAKGDPYYNTEHHPLYSNYEQVWLYTKTTQQEKITENEIIDPVTNWPSKHRYVWTKTCQMGDFFVLFDRGVVEKITKDRSGKIYGSCKIKTHEEFIPIVDEKTRRRSRTK